MNHPVLDVIVIGAGQSGITSSYYLKKNKHSHLVFERGKIAQSWITQRWHSFTLTSPNIFATLPGDSYEGDEPEVHQGAPSFATYLNDYVKRYQLPIKENSRVLSVDFHEEKRVFEVAVEENGYTIIYICRQVIISSGSMNVMKLPPIAKNLPAGINHIHAGEYRNSAQLPEGAVLVVGSAQSGSQIADDLNKAGRKVFLATSQVGRIPLVYRGKDIYHWVIGACFFGVLIDKYGVPVDLSSPPSVSLQAMAKRGVTLLGKLEKVEQDNLYFGLSVSDHIKYADDFSQNVKDIIDEFVEKNGMDVPPPDFDSEDCPDDMGCWDLKIPSINIKSENIQTVVWATGFSYDYTYINLPVLNEDGYPNHNNGVSGVPGLYFSGLYGGSSIHGVGDNIRGIMEHVGQYSTELVKEVTY
jgi:putative flavoprotein involved in K+ transport